MDHTAGAGTLSTSRLLFVATFGDGVRRNRSSSGLMTPTFITRPTRRLVGRRFSMNKLILIFIGAGLGGVLRYAVSGWVHVLAGESFPTGTLVVNLIGCFGIGFLGAALSGPLIVREEYRIAILVGLLGGFTTFSTFGSETLALVADRKTWLAALNLLLSNGLGLMGVWAGSRLSDRIYGV